ncbi:MAG TPA: periplasmic heavy metal sensor [Blastocatellia bacterium]|nr:periplasmic heavy metal sensor [Blastocatellia bacterium]
MIKRKGFVFALLVVMLIASSVAMAQGPMMPRGPRAQAEPGAGLLRLKDYLGLTDQQVSDMKALIKKHRDAAVPLVEEMKAKREVLRAALDGAEPNATTVGQLVIAERGLGKQLRALNEKLRADLLAILTQEQKDKLLMHGPIAGPRARRGGR